MKPAIPPAPDDRFQAGAAGKTSTSGTDPLFLEGALDARSTDQARPSDDFAFNASSRYAMTVLIALACCFFSVIIFKELFILWLWFGRMAPQ